MPDPHDTARLRARVLEAWAASPARFREDANAEDDLVRGGYRDRVVVELAQNAADAATRAGIPGRLRLTLTGRELVASNTGAALDSAGVESLSTLRASAKREGDTVGRFGVGFAAVLAVCDRPGVRSTDVDAAVEWSRDRAREQIAAHPALAEELGRRHGQLPVLRLPFPGEGVAEPGYTTSVVLPLRDEAARVLVARLLDDVEDALLLALPALDEVVVEVDGRTRALTSAEGSGRWHVVRREGRLDPQLLLDRPVEERDHPWWAITWARPLVGQPVPSVLHSPTPSDEPLALPALLIASFPLDPSRRHVAPGPLADFLVERAADSYAVLAAEADQPLSLVPGPLGEGPVDAALRRAVVTRLSDTPLLRSAEGALVRPRDAVSVIGADRVLQDVLAEVLAGLVDDDVRLDRLGARRIRLVDAVDQLGEIDRPPTWWRRFYAASAGLPSGELRDAFGAVPVPLADGRVVRGARGVLLAAEGLPAGLGQLGVRLVHPDATHPALLSLGAAQATARSVLELPGVRAAVEEADADDVAGVTELAETVLGLVAAVIEEGGAGPALPWLGQLLLPDDEGVPAPAEEQVLPGSLLDRVAEEGVLGHPDPGLLTRWGPDVLRAGGVLDGFRLVREHDVALDLDIDLGLSDETGWAEDVITAVGGASGLPPSLDELLAIADLDVVSDDSWAQALTAIAADPDLRAAVVDPVRVVTAEGRVVELLSYSAWYLRRHARIGGASLTSYAEPTARALVGLYDPLPVDLDDSFARALGVPTSVDDLLSEPGGADDLLDRLARPDRPVTDAALAAIYRRLATLDPDAVSPPRVVRVTSAKTSPAEDVVVVDSPQYLQLDWPAALLVPTELAAGLADVLDIALASAALPGQTVRGGQERPVPPAAGLVLAGPETWWEHESLSVDDQDVEWWVGDDGAVHAATLAGLARGLSWSGGRWDQRLLVAAVLAEPDRADELLRESRLEDG
jgi:hypothetical protein